ncbi:MAG: hypothetical protein ACKV19_27630 [Verrucomicrobiales bacterium]
MKSPTSFFSLFCLASAALIPSASGIIVSGVVSGGQSFTQGGTFIQLAPGFTESNPDNTVGNNTFQDPNLYGFNEDQNVQVAGVPLSVNILASTGLPGSLPVGTTVASHYIFFDPEGGTSQIGSVTFDADILAVVSSTGNLLASDYLANTGVTYLNPNARGLEQGDSATIDGIDPKKLNVRWTASTPGDYVRVLTKFSPGAPVPEAGATLILLVLSGGALLGARKFLS